MEMKFNVPWYELMKKELKLCYIKKGDSAFLEMKT